MPVRDASQSRRDRAEMGSLLLCILGGAAVIIALTSWAGLCQDGTHSGCRNGSPSFELVFQLVLATAGLATTFVARYFHNRRASASARVAVAVSLLLLAAWVVFVDAATSDWDDLQAWTILLTAVLILAPLALIAAVLNARDRAKLLR